jgi:two-component system, NarL family, response regulator DesR
LIRILLAQRGVLLREALAGALAAEEELAVVAQVAGGDALVGEVRRHRPHVTVIHHALPAGVALGELCRAVLGADLTAAVLVILDPQVCAGVGGELARLAPRVGLVSTESSPAQLVEAIRDTAVGKPVLDLEVAVAALTADVNPLTERERDVLRLAVDGAPTKEIARRLFLSAGTVRNYISRAVLKTGARTRLEAIRIAQEAGWI